MTFEALMAFQRDEFSFRCVFLQGITTIKHIIMPSLKKPFQETHNTK